MTSKLYSPIRWLGGKGLMTQKILPLFPSHHTYVEPFGGAASLLLAKPPAPVEVYNDLDSGLVTFFRVLQCPDQFAELQRRVHLIPYSRQEYDEALTVYRAGNFEDDIEQAVLFFTIARMSFGGNFGNSFGRVITESVKGMAQIVSNYLSAIDRLPDVVQRLRMVQIEHQSFEKIIPAFDRAETLFYVDPPYMPDTRVGGTYAHEMTEEQHEQLVQLLLDVQGKVVLSCYDHDVYTPLTRAGWVKIQFETASMTAGRTVSTGIVGDGAAMKNAARVETVYINPAAQEPDEDEDEDAPEQMTLW